MATLPAQTGALFTDRDRVLRQSARQDLLEPPPDRRCDSSPPRWCPSFSVPSRVSHRWIFARSFARARRNQQAVLGVYSSMTATARSRTICPGGSLCGPLGLKPGKRHLSKRGSEHRRCRAAAASLLLCRRQPVRSSNSVQDRQVGFDVVRCRRRAQGLDCCRFDVI